MLKSIKRVYLPAEAGDGLRVLVDRLWPRGLARDKAHVDLWLRDIAPSGALRKWFGHDVLRWDAFRVRYLAELQDATPAQELQRLRELCLDRSAVTLLYAAHDEAHNNAMVLRELLMEGVAPDALGAGAESRP